MGCDIHDYLEVRRDGVWIYAGDDAFPDNEYDFEKHSPFNGARNYDLYAFLADVRNDGETIPISQPRGLPNDTSPEVATHLAKDWYHSSSWLTLAELQEHDYERSVKAFRRGGQVETLREFLGEWYFDRLALMAQFGDPQDVRIVFAFDN